MAVVWILSNSLMSYTWIYDKSLFGLLNDDKYVIDDLRWIDFIFLTVRSFGCLLITAARNIYNSYSRDQMVLIPPDERSIDQFEMVLHNPVAVDYFYDYLEE